MVSMTRSEWEAIQLHTWTGQPCPGCGRETRAYQIDDAGIVWSWCRWCERDIWTACPGRPASFAPEVPEPDGLPF